jgi:hypothetical protein
MRGPQPSLPRANVRNRKTRNPGFEPGNHWLICDRCGCAVRSMLAKVTWEGYVVCPDDWEPRHPQDFVRAKFDRIAPEGLIRPEEGEGTLFISPFCSTNTAICDVAIADCAICDNTQRFAYTSQIPTPTFGGL